MTPGAGCWQVFGLTSAPGEPGFLLPTASRRAPKGPRQCHRGGCSRLPLRGSPGLRTGFPFSACANAQAPTQVPLYWGLASRSTQYLGVQGRSDLNPRKALGNHLCTGHPANPYPLCSGPSGVPRPGTRQFAGCGGRAVAPARSGGQAPASRASWVARSTELRRNLDVPARFAEEIHDRRL